MAVNKLALVQYGFTEVALPECATIKFLVANFPATPTLAGEGKGYVFVLFIIEISHSDYFTLSYPSLDL